MSEFILVTGPQTFKYFKLQDTHNMQVQRSSLNKKEQHISSHYTCHCWLADGRFLVGTDQGDIIYCE